VTNARGEITAVEGDGVVGQTPTIPPGDSFSYNSFHLFDTRTAVRKGVTSVWTAWGGGDYAHPEIRDGSCGR